MLRGQLASSETETAWAESSLAIALLEHGATKDALEIAEHGLSLAGELWTLATWLRDYGARPSQEEVNHPKRSLAV